MNNSVNYLYKLALLDNSEIDLLLELEKLNDESINFLTNKIYGKLEKQNFIVEVFESEKVIYVLNSIIEKNNYNDLKNFKKIYLQKLEKEEKILNFEIKVTTKTNKEDIDQIMDQIQSYYDIKNKTFKITYDDSIIGGFIVLVNNKIYDASIISKLNKLRG